MRISQCAGLSLLLGAAIACYSPDLQDEHFNALRCVCACGESAHAFPGAGIAAGSDDGQKVGTNQIDVTGRTLALGTSAGNPTIVAFRFAALGIPPGSTIQPGSAFIQFTSSSTDSAPAAFQIYVEDTDDATPLTGAPELSVRALTSPVDWNITTAWGVDDVGPAQRTPDLASILQAVIQRPGWSQNNAVVILIKGTGTRGVRSFEADPAKTATLSFTYAPPTFSRQLRVCLPDNLKTTGQLPSEDLSREFCETTVARTLSGLTLQCKYGDFCNCQFQSQDFFVSVTSCMETCVANDLATDCSNLDPENGNTVATNAPGDAPICTAHSPLASALYGRRSQCNVEGTATVQPSGEDPETTGAHGVVEFKGDPCPGQSCAVAMEHDLRFDDVTFGNILGSSTFSNLSVLGHSAGGQEAVLAADGSGAFGIGATSSVAAGRRDNDEGGALPFSNQDVVGIAVNWQPGAAIGCGVEGALSGTFNPEIKRCENPPNDLCTTDPSVCGSSASCTGADNGDGTFVCQCQEIASSDANVSVSVQGRLVNQPPIAVAGPDRVIECNGINKSAFTLDGAGTHDVDNNLATLRWFRGGRMGDLIGFLPKIPIEQGLGSEVRYVLRAIDAYGQADESSTKRKVVDTTPALIACNAPATMTANQVPLTFTATASDVCDPSVAPVITSFSCFKVSKTGVVSKVDSCVVRLQGNRITIVNSGGVDDHIRWQVSAADDSNNASTATCEVLVVQKK